MPLLSSAYIHVYIYCREFPIYKVGDAMVDDKNDVMPLKLLAKSEPIATQCRDEPRAVIDLTNVPGTETLGK